MRGMSAEGRATMAKRRDFVNYARMILSDGTVLNLQPRDFRVVGNSFTDDLVDGDNFQVGTVIGKTVNIRLDNTDERFSQYDFYMARFVLYIHLPDAYEDEHGDLQDEIFTIGLFTVTEPTTTGIVIDIAGIDEMYKLDKSFDSCNLDFSLAPTLSQVLIKCCNDCDIPVGFSTFDNSSMTVTHRPEGVTYREVVSYVCQMAGVNAKINATGSMVLTWYDMSMFTTGLDGGTFNHPGTTAYRDGDTADGGTFNPWNTGDVYDGGNFNSAVTFHQLSQVTGLQVSTDDIRFTGVMVTNEDLSVIAPSTTQQPNAVRITFGSQSETESTSYDWVWIYCKDDNDPTKYRRTQKYAGRGSSNNIANKQVIIPSQDFYVYFRSDTSQTYYGFDIASVEAIYVEPANLWQNFESGTQDALPEIIDSYTLNGVSIKPETAHPYSNNQKICWEWKTGLIRNYAPYVLEIKDNPFTIDKEDVIASFLYNKLSSLVFRPFSCSYLQDPTIEAGDAAMVWDIKGNSYKTIITNVTYNINGMMTVASKAQNPTRQGSSYKNVAARAVIEARRSAEREVDAYATAVDHFNEIANNALGYYKTEQTEQGATITYYHDAPTLGASTNIVKVTASGIFISDDGGQSYTSGWETSTATMLMNLVYAHGITADWVTSGLFQDQQGKFVLNMDTGVLHLDLTSGVGDTTLGAMLTKINATEQGLSSEVTRATTAEGELNSIYSGAYEPTVNNAPASSWTTAELKQKHLNDLFYNTSNGNSYQWKNTGGIKIIFSSDSATESTSWDWVEIYYYDTNAGQYKKSTKLGGTGSSNNIAGAEIVIPSPDFYVYFKSDQSNHDYYGFSISSVALTSASPSSFTNAGSSLPTSVTTVLNGTSTKPETAHPYSDNQELLWEWHTQLSSSYSWEIRQDIQTMHSSITQTASEIALEVTARENADTSLSSRITTNANNISLKVSKGDVSSQLSVESGQITLASGRLIINTGNFQIDSNGTITCYGANINGQFHCSSNDGRIDIAGNKITGNNDSYIDFRGLANNKQGIHINANDVVFSSDRVRVTRSRGATTVIDGGTGYCWVQVHPRSGGDAYWLRIEFVHGIMVNDLSNFE